MILTLIGIGLVVIGFIIMYVYFNNLSLSEVMDSVLCASGIISTGLGLTITFLCIVFIVFSHLYVDKQIYNSKLEYESIVKQVECIKSDYEDYSTIEVIDRAYEWNNKVYNTMYWSKNILSNWFYSKKYVESLKYIELDDLYLRKEK